MKMYARTERRMLRKPFDSLRQSMHVAVFPTEVTEIMMIVDAGFPRGVQALS